MDLDKIMQQAQAMQAKMAKTQDSIHQVEIDGQSGGGMVKIVLNGKSELRRIEIDPQLMSADDKEILEDLIVAAHNDAHNRLNALIKEETGKVMGGLQMPAGFNPFGG